MREYVWLGLVPVVYVDHASGAPVTYYVLADQVGEPQKLTNAAGAVVWDRIANPWGEEVSVTGSLTQPIRFPGQRHDAETALADNWHRTYDPTLGRYIQSDPIGLMGGISTYGYVGGNPVRFVDFNGLEVYLGSEPVFGPAQGNHAFIHSDEAGPPRGRDGSSGDRRSDGVPDDFYDNPGKYRYTPIPLPEDMTDEEFMACINAYPGWEKGIYFPWIDDCQNEAEEAMRYCGVENPPRIPDGRTALDELMSLPPVSRALTIFYGRR